MMRGISDLTHCYQSPCNVILVTLSGKRLQSLGTNRLMGLQQPQGVIGATAGRQSGRKAEDLGGNCTTAGENLSSFAYPDDLPNCSDLL